MIFYKNITYEEMLDFAEWLVNKHSISLQDDLVQIKKFREIVTQASDREGYQNWLYFIEGWVMD